MSRGVGGGRRWLLLLGAWEVVRLEGGGGLEVEWGGSALSTCMWGGRLLICVKPGPAPTGAAPLLLKGWGSILMARGAAPTLVLPAFATPPAPEDCGGKDRLQ